MNLEFKATVYEAKNSDSSSVVAEIAGKYGDWVRDWALERSDPGDKTQRLIFRKTGNVDKTPFWEVRQKEEELAVSFKNPRATSTEPREEPVFLAVDIALFLPGSVVEHSGADLSEFGESIVLLDSNGRDFSGGEMTFSGRPTNRVHPTWIFALPALSVLLLFGIYVHDRRTSN